MYAQTLQALWKKIQRLFGRIFAIHRMLVNEGSLIRVPIVALSERRWDAALHSHVEAWH